MELPVHNHPAFSLSDEAIKDKLYDAILLGNLQALAMVDEEWRFTIANDAFCSQLGLPQGHRLSNFHISFLPFYELPDFKTRLEQLQSSAISRFELESEVDSLDGRTKYLKLTMVRLGKDRHLFEGAALFLTDLSRNHRKQEGVTSEIRDLKTKIKKLKKYIEANLQLENFTYLASHDLKEPLRIIGNFSQLLERKYGSQLDETGNEYLGFVIDGVQKMNDFIDGLLNFSQLDKTDHRNQSIDTEELLFLLTRELEQAAIDQNATIQIANMPREIIGDRDKLKWLFKLLLENALKFKKQGVDLHVKVSGCERGDYWQFSVADNGIGIEAEYFERIFLLFKRLHLRSTYPGIGMGLTIAKKIVLQHDGDIWLESTPGIGSTFHFTLKKPETFS